MWYLPTLVFIQLSFGMWYHYNLTVWEPDNIYWLCAQLVVVYHMLGIIILYMLTKPLEDPTYDRGVKVLKYAFVKLLMIGIVHRVSNMYPYIVFKSFMLIVGCLTVLHVVK